MRARARCSRAIFTLYRTVGQLWNNSLLSDSLIIHRGALTKYRTNCRSVAEPTINYGENHPSDIALHKTITSHPRSSLFTSGIITVAIVHFSVITKYIKRRGVWCFILSIIYLEKVARVHMTYITRIRCPSHATNDMQKRILCELSRSTYSHTRRTIRFSREAHLFKTDICPRLLFSSFYSFFFPQINNNINWHRGNSGVRFFCAVDNAVGSQTGSMSDIGCECVLDFLRSISVSRVNDAVNTMFNV